MTIRKPLLLCALAASIGLSGLAHAQTDRQSQGGLRIDCAAPYPATIVESIARAGLKDDPSYTVSLTHMLEPLSIAALASLDEPSASAVLDRLGLLVDEGLMISSEIVHLQALEAVPAWRESRHAGLFTRMLQTVYEPYHPDDHQAAPSFPSRASQLADEMNAVDKAFNDALTTARNQVIEASRSIPGFFDRPIRWYIQGVVYDDPVARHYAAGQICADDALRERVPAINQEVAKIAEASHE